MTVTLYTKPVCVQCNASKKRLNAKTIEHGIIDMSVDDNALAMVKGLGFLQAPVIVVKDAEGNIIDSWSGFQPEKIDALAAA